MRRHWKALQWAMITLMTSLIVALIEGWYVLNYGLIVTAVVYAFVYAIHVTRFDGKPSYEDEDRQQKRRAEEGVRQRSDRSGELWSTDGQRRADAISK